jgi:hypothetical protein
MSEKHYSTGDHAGSGAVELDSPIKSARPLLSEYAERFNQARIAAESAEDKAAAPVYQFLGLLCAVGESFETGVRPFSHPCFPDWAAARSCRSILGAMIPLEGSTWLVKLEPTPAALVAKQKANFMAFLDSIKPATAAK